MMDIVMVNFWVEPGCDPKEEVDVAFETVNRSMGFDCKLDELKEATDQYIADNDLSIETMYEVIFALKTERDRAGAAA